LRGGRALHGHARGALPAPDPARHREMPDAAGDRSLDARGRGALPAGLRPEPGRAQTRAMTRQPLVPPKPKLLDITVSSGLSIRSRAIGRSANAGSSVSMLALSATKPLFSISSE